MWNLYAFYGFMSACFQLPEVALRMFLLQNLGVGPSAYGFIISMGGIPWALKPIIGVAVDMNPYRKQSVVLSGIAILVPWLFIGFGFTTSSHAISALIGVSSLGLCYADVVCDAELVNMVKKEDNSDVGKLQSNCWIARAVGSTVAAVFGAVIVYGMSARHALLFTPLAGIAACICLYRFPFPSRSCEGCGEAKKKAIDLKKALSSEHLARPCIFIFVLCAVPSYGATMMAFLQSELKFTPLQFMIIDISGHAAHGFGAVLFKKKMRNFSFRYIFMGGILTDVALQGIQIMLIYRVNTRAHVPDLFLAVCETISGAVIGQVMMMPICILAARNCPPHIEATLYSTVMAISNMGGLCAMWSGAWMTRILRITSTDFHKLGELSIICVISSAIPLLFVRFMPLISATSATDDTVEIELTERHTDSLQTGQVQDSLVNQRYKQSRQKT